MNKGLDKAGKSKGFLAFFIYRRKLILVKDFPIKGE